MNKNFDPQLVETILANAVKAGSVSNNVYKGQRPNTTDTKMADFVVVSLSSNVTDLAALGRCTCRIELFAKNLSNGEKNGAKLSILYTKLREVFPILDDTYLFDINPSIIPLGDDGYGYNVIAIQIQTLIKTL